MAKVPWPGWKAMAFTGNTTSFPSSFFLCACFPTIPVSSQSILPKKTGQPALRQGVARKQHLEGVLLCLHMHPGKLACLTSMPRNACWT